MMVKYSASLPALIFGGIAIAASFSETVSPQMINALTGYAIVVALIRVAISIDKNLK